MKGILKRSFTMGLVLTTLSTCLEAGDIQGNLKTLVNMGYSPKMSQEVLGTLGDPYSQPGEKDEEIYENGKLSDVITAPRKKSKEEALVEEVLKGSPIPEPVEIFPIEESLHPTLDPRKNSPQAVTMGVPMEVDHLVEQLYYLGLERGFKPSAQLNGKIPLDTQDFWNRVKNSLKSPQGPEVIPVPQEVKNRAKEHFSQMALHYGFVLEKLEIKEIHGSKETPSENRMVILAEGYHPQKTHYLEAQMVLKELNHFAKQACNQNGKNYYGPLSTFITKNPQARLYYAKTHVMPQ